MYFHMLQCQTLMLLVQEMRSQQSHVVEFQKGLAAEYCLDVTMLEMKMERKMMPGVRRMNYLMQPNSGDVLYCSSHVN